jgi:DNA-binding XRE family transcriptional regulator
MSIVTDQPPETETAVHYAARADTRAACGLPVPNHDTTTGGRWVTCPTCRAALAAAISPDPLIQQLVTHRLTLRMSQVRLAQVMGTTQSAVHALETGLAEATLPVLHGYARAVGCDLAVVPALRVTGLTPGDQA